MRIAGLCFAAAVLLAGCGSSEQAQQAQPPSAEPLAPPLMKIAKLSHPCPGGHPKTTLDIEACYRRATIVEDRGINAAVRGIYRALAAVDKAVPQSGRFHGSARRRFVRSERAWQAFRAANCTSFADVHAGGSVSAIDTAACEFRRDQQHLRELLTLGCYLSGNGTPKASCLRRVPEAPADAYPVG